MDGRTYKSKKTWQSQRLLGDLSGEKRRSSSQWFLIASGPTNYLEKLTPVSWLAPPRQGKDSLPNLSQENNDLKKATRKTDTRIWVSMLACSYTAEKKRRDSKRRGAMWISEQNGYSGVKINWGNQHPLLMCSNGVLSEADGLGLWAHFHARLFIPGGCLPRSRHQHTLVCSELRN